MDEFLDAQKAKKTIKEAMVRKTIFCLPEHCIQEVRQKVDHCYIPWLPLLLFFDPIILDGPIYAIAYMCMVHWEVLLSVRWSAYLVKGNLWS